MPVEFEPTSDESEPAGELLGAPRRIRRSRIAIGTAAGVALVAGGIAVGLTQTSASASPASVLAAASSAAGSGTPAPHARASGTDGAGGRGAFKPGQPIWFGAVTSAKSATITITDQQGFTRTIVTSSSTTYKDGLTSTPAVGTKIIAQGTVDKNGTSLDATAISALPKGVAGPGPGRLGPGGPGGFGRPAGPRPSGSQTAKPNGKAHLDPSQPAPTATATTD